MSNNKYIGQVARQEWQKIHGKSWNKTTKHKVSREGK